ncbi:MAG: hypothetical protein GY716_06215 [bacterium]|nr:hypothetical protein [bacterium]
MIARVAPALLVALCLTGTVADAATNQATGDVGGVPAALTDSNVFTLNSTGNQLAVVKRAFLSDGTAVPTSSTVPSGTLLKFLIYVSNDSTVQINDISIQDVLDPVFVYQSNSIKIDNTVAACAPAGCTALEEDAIFAAIDDNTALTDAISTADAAGLTSGPPDRIDAGNEAVANLQLNAAGSSVLAVLFTVQMP